MYKGCHAPKHMAQGNHNVLMLIEYAALLD